MESSVQEKRKWFRHNVESAVGVNFSIHGQRRELAGMLNDKSEQGIGIATTEIIAPGTMLDITLIAQIDEDIEEEQHFTGEVRWCRPSDFISGTYLLGIKSHDEKIIH
jgi:hypothetical protein